MNTELLKKADEYVLKNKDEMLDCIKKLVAYPSVKGEPTADTPYGKACLDCLCEALGMMKDAGFEVQLAPSKKYGLATMGEGEKCIGLFGHTDVVPVNENDWIYTKPFEAKIVDNMLIGRGVEDDKGGVVVSLYAIKLLCELGLAPKSKIVVFLGSNEEDGMDDVDEFSRDNKAPDVCIVPDSHFPVCFGEKGICRFYTKVPGKFEQITELKGGSAYNILLDRVDCKVKYDEKLFSEISALSCPDVSAKLSDDGKYIELVAHGIPKHASLPEGGVNAACELAKALCFCPSLCENDRKILENVATLTGDFYGESVGLACSDEYFGKLTFVNGMCHMEDGSLHLSFDIRYGTSISGAQLEEKIKEIFPESILYDNSEGFAIPRNDKIANVLEKVYADFSGNPDRKGFYMGGGSYARKLKNAFSVGVQVDYLKDEGLALPKGHGNAHQSDESLKIKSFLEAVKVVAMMIHECDKAINE